MSSYIGYRDGAGFTNEQGLKQELNKLFTKGVSSVHSSTSLAVSQRGAGANMSVDVAIGDAHLVLPSGLYSYWGWTDAVTNITITAANPANPRIDVVVAYVDLSVASGTNNPGALKFTAVAGTAAGSPSAPSDSTIQAALGASVPFIKLAQVAVAASASNIVDANITDARQPVAAKTRLWGGSSNTNGHTVPNAADSYFALTSDTGGKVNYAALLSTIFSGQVLSQANAGTAGGTMKYINLGGIKLLWVISANQNAGATGLTYTFTLPASFFMTVTTAQATSINQTTLGEQYANVVSASSATVTVRLTSPGGAATSGISLLVIGT